MKKVIGDLTVYDVRGAAEMLDLSIETIRRHIRSGRLRARRFSRRYWITLEELQRAMLPEGTNDESLKR